MFNEIKIRQCLAKVIFGMPKQPREKKVKLQSFILPFLTMSLLSVAPASATVLTFDIDRNGSQFTDTNGSLNALVEYGDNVNSTNRTTTIGLATYDYSYLEGNGFTPNITAAFDGHNSNRTGLWSTGYGDLEQVLWGSSVDGDYIYLSLTPETGYEVILNSFDLGSWQEDRVFEEGTDYLQILTGSTVHTDYLAEATAGSLVIQGGEGHSSFSPNLASEQAITLRFAPNWLGVDNVNFDQRIIENDDSTRVPAPGTLGLFGLGLAALGGLARRRH